MNCTIGGIGGRIGGKKMRPGKLFSSLVTFLLPTVATVAILQGMRGEGRLQTKNVGLTEETYRRLRALAGKLGCPIGRAVDALLDEHDLNERGVAKAAPETKPEV